MKVLVVGASNNASLSIVQSLGKFNNIIDLVGTREVFNKGFYSKYVRNKFLISPVEESICLFLKTLVKIIKANSYDFVIPTNDRMALVLSKLNDESCIGSTKILVPPYNQLMNAMDKGFILKCAKKFNCPIPKTVFTDQNFSEVEKAICKLNFPIVLKPRFSWYIHGDKLVKGKIEYIINPTVLKERFNEVNEIIPYPLLQEQIRGTAWGMELLFWDNSVKAIFSHKRIRESNPLGSYSSAVESIPINTEYLEYICSVLKFMKWNGVCMFEFKNDDADNIPKLMEMNARFWGSLPLAVRCGVDFPLYLIQIYKNEPVIKKEEYATGVRCRWLIADIVHFLKVMKGRPRGWQGYFPSRKSTFKEFIKFRSYFSYNNEYDDPLPGLLELLIEPINKIQNRIIN